jgi:hypothetical protein
MREAMAPSTRWPNISEQDHMIAALAISDENRTPGELTQRRPATGEGTGSTLTGDFMNSRRWPEDT